ncbi:hypothetical protein [Streptomyces sp. NPDC049040]|uniref:hypothetical protein n=1 Tax=Streptomyces sp. NPDC049040 TaxID=3365593 RepID=UPI00371C3DF6
MLTRIANEDSRLSLWLHVRMYAVPAPMIETATARRLAGDWAGACAAARLDVDLTPRSVARTHGRETAARVRADLRRLAPDLLRWHMPRVAPDGVLRPGLTLQLARYDTEEGPLRLVARTPPGWADAGQRISLALWDGSRDRPGARRHPHPRPDRRFRFDLHRHLWDAERSGELPARSGSRPQDGAGRHPLIPHGPGCAVDRWAAEAAILLRAEGRSRGAVAVRLGGRNRLVLHVDPDISGPPPPVPRITPWPAGGDTAALPLLPDAATWVPPDLELLRAGLIEKDLLHPLVAAALSPGWTPGRSPTRDGPGRPRLVECRGERHRIGLVDGVLTALDHGRDEIRREELLAELTGTPLPCLQAIDTAHRQPDCLADVRGRLDHGDTAAALAAVESLIGPDAQPRDGALRDELATAAERRLAHALYRADLWNPWPGPRTGPVPRLAPHEDSRTGHRSRPRLAHAR